VRDQQADVRKRVREWVAGESQFKVGAYCRYNTRARASLGFSRQVINYFVTILRGSICNGIMCCAT